MRTLKAVEIEVRIGQVGFNKKTNQGYATLLLYKNARTDMQVLFYKLEDGKFLIDIPEMTELEQHIDVEEMFK